MNSINNFLKDNNGHVLQSPQWGMVREKEGHKVIDITIQDEDDNIVIHSQLVLHKLPKWFPTLSRYIGEVWRGPVFKKDLTIEEVDRYIEQYFNKVYQISVENKVLAIKYEPKIIKDSYIANIFIKKLIPSSNSFIPSTGIIDITRDENIIFDSFNKYTRKNIRKAINKGVQIRISSEKEDLISAVDRLYPLLIKTSDRADFRIRPLFFYKSLIEMIDDNLSIYIIEATVDNNLAASYFVMKYHDVLYTPYSGSDRKYSEYKANELINWELIKLGKHINATKYDQWGVLSPSADSKDPMWGVTNFKLGFSGILEEYIGAYDLVIDHFGYKIFTLAWSIRKVLKSIKRLIR